MTSVRSIQKGATFTVRAGRSFAGARWLDVPITKRPPTSRSMPSRATTGWRTSVERFGAASSYGLSPAAPWGSSGSASSRAEAVAAGTVAAATGCGAVLAAAGCTGPPAAPRARTTPVTAPTTRTTAVE